MAYLVIAIVVADVVAVFGCATAPPAHEAAEVRCPPPPPPIYSNNCVLKKDVIDVADRMLNENEAAEMKLASLEKSFMTLEEDVARALKASLKTVVNDQASVAIVGGRVRVRLSEELLFPSASAADQRQRPHALAQVTDVLRRTPVAPHRDRRPHRRSPGLARVARQLAALDGARPPGRPVPDRPRHRGQADLRRRLRRHRSRGRRRQRRRARPQPPRRALHRADEARDAAAH